MPLFEYRCLDCQLKFEVLVSSNGNEVIKCSKCQSKNTEKLISRFAVGGQGDLRESTMHGCHDHSTGLQGDHCAGGPCHKHGSGSHGSDHE